MEKALNIRRVSLMSNSFGLLGACAVIGAGYDSVYIVDGHITVLAGRNGFSFKNHKTGKAPTEEMQKIIIRAIEKKQGELYDESKKEKKATP